MDLQKERLFNEETKQKACNKILKENKLGQVYLEKRHNEVEKSGIVENPEEMKRGKKYYFSNLKYNKMKKIRFLDYFLNKQKQKAVENNLKLLQKKKYRDESSQEYLDSDDYVKIN